MARKLFYPNGYDKNVYYRNPKIEIRNSKIHGVGMFATKAIKKNEVLEEDPFIILKGDWHKIPRLLQEYIFGWTKDMDDAKSKAALVFGTGAIYNSSPKPNADWLTDARKKRFVYYAYENIKAGEEIMIDYGPEYWESRKKKYKKD
jgi:SET domain-containing protein